MRRGIHTKPVRGMTNDWITPPEIIRSLGKFDLDPCAHPCQFTKTASVMISPPSNGLDDKFDWAKRVWLNPPYGDEITAWMKKMAEHGNGVALVPARTEVESWFWPYVWDSADAVLFLKGRLYFLTPSGEKRGNAGHGSVLVAYGAENVSIIRDCGIKGKYIRL